MSKDLGDIYDRLSQIRDLETRQADLAARQLVLLEEIKARGVQQLAVQLEQLAATKVALGVANAQTKVLLAIERHTRKPEIGAATVVVRLSQPIDNEEN